MTGRTTVRLPEDLLNRAKRKAAAEGRTLTSLIEDGLRLMMAEHQKNTKRKRVLPRISKATGGLIPGIELTDLSALQEIDDLDDVCRMKRPMWVCCSPAPHTAGCTIFGRLVGGRCEISSQSVPVTPAAETAFGCIPSCRRATA